ncbi:hypothetical protein ACJRO7_016113 [Eucalyptus globulus]|uniref:Glyoxalase/fosfomycin resistance/dioxygenase domain-containing protein n=1 Tax=Eucalyptus globulus TaxID=34317 RepID=A0ABD3L9P1_EUCGL
MQRWLRESSSSSSSSSSSMHQQPRLPLLSLNHVSFVCKSVAESVRFYERVLGFVLIKRPSSFNFEGAWLFNYGIGIHLLEVEDVPAKKGCSDMKLVMKKPEEMNIEYVTAVVEEGGIKVDQLFFHDLDCHMIENCNCDNLPVLPLSSCPLKLPKLTRTRPRPHCMVSSRIGVRTDNAPWKSRIR